MASKTWLGTTDAAFGTSGNWSPSGAPTTGDDVVFDGRSIRAIDGSDQSAITLASLRIYKSCSTDIGSVATPLKIGATICQIGVDTDGATGASGPSLIALDFYSIQTTVSVFDGTRTTAATGATNAVMLRGTHASNVLTVYGGSVGVGMFVLNEATTFATIHVHGSTSRVTIGAGVTLTTLNQTTDGSRVFLNCAATTINQDGGTLETRGTGAITTVNALGTFTSNSTGTITTLNVSESGLADLAKSPAARTITNCNLYGSRARINADNNSVLAVTFTNGVDCLQGAKTSQVNFGDTVTVTPSAL